MADEKTVTLASAKSPTDWVNAYYGDDALDYKKVNKIKHIKHTGQFASICYMISNNSKQAHADFFDSNYASLDTMYERVAEICLKLLYIKFSENRPLNKGDFINAGGGAMFGKNADAFAEDYIGAGGLVDKAQTLLPISADSEKTANMIKEINDDMSDVKRDHTYLLAVTGDQKDGVLSREHIFEMFNATTDACSGMWKQWKGAKSEAEKDLQKDMEDAYYAKYDLAKASGKMALVGGVAATSVGAVIGGVFWPALLLIPAYSFAKTWSGDWTKALGKVWGNFEKRMKDKRAINRADAMQKWLVGFAQNNKEQKLPWKYRKYIRPADKTLLKKQAKVIAEGMSLEYLDEKVHKGSLQEAQDALMASNSFSKSKDITETDNLVPVDAVDLLKKYIKELTIGEKPTKTNPNPRYFENATLDNFQKIASRIDKWSAKIPSDSLWEIKLDYAKKLDECAPHLIFETKLERASDFVDKMPAYFNKDGLILKTIQEVKPEGVTNVNRLIQMGKGELTKLGNAYIGQTLKDYIFRNDGSPLTAGSPELDLTKYTNQNDPYLVNALNLIANLQVDSKDVLRFTSNGTSVENISNAIRLIGNSSDRTKANEALNKQMVELNKVKARELSQKTYDSILEGGYSGKFDYPEYFTKIGEIKTYEDVNKVGTLFANIGKITEPDTQNYVKTKLSKAIYDILAPYAADNGNKFKSDLKLLTEYLKTVNSNKYINEQQKMELTSAVIPYVSSAVGFECSKVSNAFITSYDPDNFRAYREDSYENGGLLDLFNTDQSPEIQQVKHKVEFMKRLKSVQESLKLHGHPMSKTDEAIIGKILIKQEPEFETTRSREPNDKLVKFLAEKINVNNSYSDFAVALRGANGLPDVSKLSNFITANNTPYSEIQDKLSEVSSWVGDANKFDKYAGLVALKNSCVVEMRTSLFKLTDTLSTDGYLDTWLKTDDGKMFFTELLGIWKRGLIHQIDSEIDSLLTSYPEITNVVDVTKHASQELKRYDSGYKSSLITEKTLD